MGRLVYAAIASLDGYVADVDGNFEALAPDEEVHAAVNDLMRPVGTHLYGRRMYEVLVAWETMGHEPDDPEPIRDYAELWRRADKVIYSSTMTSVGSARTRIEPTFDVEAVSRLKDESSADLCLGGPHLAGQAIAAGLVDDLHVFVVPVVLGGGNPALAEGLRVELELVEERRFAGGVVQLHYRPLGSRPTA